MMSAVGWIALVRLCRSAGTRAVRGRCRRAPARKAAPAIESLEPIALLSAGRLPLGIAAVHRHDPDPHRLAARAPRPGDSAVADAPVTLPAQTLALGNTLTRFQDLPLSPPLSLFDPALGTLTSVTVTQDGLVQGTITATNENANTRTVTLTLTGGYQINGLNQAIVQPTESVSGPPQVAGPFGSSTDTVTSPPLQISHPSTTTYTDPATLAFYTASPGRSTLTATMSAAATSSASLSSFATGTQASASATVTVTYAYTPPPCPTAGTIGRIGVHHQRTLLVLPFQGVVNPALADDPGHYTVIAPTGQKTRIISASYNPATHSVTLRTARPLNVHDHFTLSAVMPCASGDTGDVARVPFGSKFSLIGFHNKRGQFVSVSDGRIVRVEHRPRVEHHRPGR